MAISYTADKPKTSTVRNNTSVAKDDPSVVGNKSKDNALDAKRPVDNLHKPNELGALASASSGLISRVQPSEGVVSEIAGEEPAASTIIPNPKMGRPRTGYIKAEYNRQYSADKRAADKIGISVREYRERNAIT